MIFSAEKTMPFFRLAALAAQHWRRAQEPTGFLSQDAMAVDGRISAALQQVSADRIRANIEKLVSFGTRSDHLGARSASIAAGRGIGAAREWIKSEFERYSKDCGGCLEVKTDTFTNRRRPHSATYGNHQCLCGSEGYRCRERQAHRAGDRAL